MMNSHLVLLHPTPDVNHGFVQSYYTIYVTHQLVTQQPTR
jgi:hypothetical protein